MCSNAASTVAALMGAIEPSLVDLLTVLGIADTPQGQAAITAYNAALSAVQNWKSGTSAQDVIQVINAFTLVFNTLPIPADAKTLADIISAGIVVVIGVLTGNSPVPAPIPGDASKEESQASHAISAAQDAEAKVEALIPGFKRSHFHSPASQFKTAWNKQVALSAATDPKYAVLKQA
jgi:hypothetical protein